jgi:uncharacterized protein with PIN domain
MMTAAFTFHGTLNDFLPRHRRNTTFEHVFDWKASVKDMLESFGPPHPEFELITANGASVGFDHIVQPDDAIHIYPYSDAETVDVTPKIVLRPPYSGRPRFVLDQHLGRTAAYLRMMGFDTLYRNDYDDEELAQVSDTEQRILLTRDIGLLKRGRVMYGYFVRNTSSVLSLKEITERFHLAVLAAPFDFCMKCNGVVLPVDKALILDRLKPETAASFELFHQCQSCGQVYWKGSHHEKMEAILREVLDK